MERRDIISIVTMAGAIQATPELVLLAPTHDRVRFASDAVAGRSVRAGDLLATQGVDRIVAPVAGFVTGRLVADSVVVAKNIPIVVMRYEAFGVLATVPADLAYRIYQLPATGRTQVTGGPGPSACRVFRAPAAGAAARPQLPGLGSESTGAILCLLPADAPVIDGLPALLALETARRSAVLTLPTLAVAGSISHGTVTKVSPGGSRQNVEVALGVSDGTRVEIVNGLAEGDLVLAIAPDLDVTGG